MDLLFRLSKSVDGFNDIHEAKEFFRVILPKRNNNHFYNVNKFGETLTYGDIIYFAYDSILVAKATYLGAIKTNKDRSPKFIYGHKVNNIQILDSNIKLNNKITGNRTTYVKEDIKSEINRVLQRIDINTLSNDIEEIVNNPSIEDTEKLRLVNSRIGQEQFRKSLIDYWGKCTVTGYENKSVLVASHIKPWSHSSDSERLDKFNGLLLTPILDRAFDQGLVSFSTSGNILISPLFLEFSKLGLRENMFFKTTVQHEKYMKYHRKHVYKT